VGYRGSRLSSLDGLRGVASLVVLVHHSLLSIPVLAVVYFGQPAAPGLIWLVNSPLHAVWAGTEAVYVFFILSGVVLTLPALRHRYDWRSYYPSRLMRLYLPVLASVVLAVVCVLLVPRSGTEGHGLFMEQQNRSVSLVGVLKDATLVAPGWLNAPLWSLRWEVLFSILLPVYLFLAIRFAKQWWLLVAVSVAASWLGNLVPLHGVLMYLPMFLVGAAVAPALQNGASSSKRLWSGLVILGAVAITSPWWLTPGLAKSHQLLAPLVLVSALVIVMGAVRAPGFRALLESRVAQWFGKISFSLYLTHNLIVVAVATVLPVELAWVTPLVSIPVSIAVAWLFFRFVESPSHRLAKRVAIALASGRNGTAAVPSTDRHAANE
jgi:peptidoglycan/LPS O-acetylase OafA/YrhL